jgi:hypothetical protein
VAKFGDSGCRRPLEGSPADLHADDHDRTAAQPGRRFGWQDPGTLRKLMATRFRALIAATA